MVPVLTSSVSQLTIFDEYNSKVSGNNDKKSFPKSVTLTSYFSIPLSDEDVAAVLQLAAI